MKVLIKFITLFTLSFIIVMGIVAAMVYQMRDQQLPGEKWIQSKFQKAAIDSSLITGIPTPEQLRAQDYENRKLTLDQKEMDMRKEQDVIDHQKDSLSVVKQQLDELMGQKEQVKLDRIKKLAKVYEGMRPEEAAPILSELDDLTIVSILLEMENRRVSKILGQMTPDRATEISQRLTGSF